MSHAEAHVMHHDAPEVVGRRERLGVRLIIVADGSFVFAMIFSYFYLRNLDANGGWLPDKAHTFSVASGWLVAIPMVVAALLHKLGERNSKSYGAIAPLAFLALLVGTYLQWHQLSSMPFIVPDEGRFEGAYASMWMIIGGANLFHYLVGMFVALGLAIRARRVHLAAELESWRLKTAGSWFSWIAVSALLCALTMSFI